MSFEPLDLENSKEGERLKALLRQAQVGMCVNGVTHDANNMMGAIMAYAELVGMDEELSEKKRRMLQQITENVERCSDLLNKLTDIARKDTDLIGYCDIAQILGAALKLCNYDLNAQRITVETILPPMMDGIMGSPPKLQLAFIQLLYNAGDALQDCEEKVLRITLEDQEEGVEVAFWNSESSLTESGFKEALQPYTTTRTGAHIGLGLPMVQEIVEEKHNGTLSYSQDRGIILALPRRLIT